MNFASRSKGIKRRGLAKGGADGDNRYLKKLRMPSNVIRERDAITYIPAEWLARLCDRPPEARCSRARRGWREQTRRG